MTMLDEILSRIPRERREDFLRLVNGLNVRSDSPDLVQAYLAVEALAPMLEAFGPLAEETPNRIEAVLRLQAEPVAKTIASVVGPAVVSALRNEVSESLTAQHDVAMEAHAMARRAVENLETRVAERVDRVATAGKHAAVAAGIWYPFTAALSLVLLLAAVFIGGPEKYDAGFEAGKYAQFHADATLYRRDPLRWRAYANNDSPKR